MVYREGERKFCMGEGTEDRMQAYMKHVVLEPEHEKEYAQPLLTLVDELHSWDHWHQGQPHYILYRAGGGCGASGQRRDFRHLPGAATHPRGAIFGSGHFSTVHEMKNFPRTEI